MEAILVDCVHNSLRNFMIKNSIFLCERLCAEFPSEINMQLLASCYLQNNQAYSAYHILKGTQMAQSRYLFAISCFQMDLLNEAESALCPANEPSAEIPNGAAGHYLLGLIFRYTDRRKNAVHHFKQALSMDPLLWAAYEELCILGAAEEANAVFGDAAALCIQKQYFHHGLASPNIHMCNEDHNSVSARNFGSEGNSPRQLKQTQGNNLRDIPGNYHGASMMGGAATQPLNSGSSNMSFYSTPSPMATQLSGVAPPPLCRNLQPNGPNLSALSADSSPRSTVNSTIQAPRRKFVDEGKLRKISGRLFSDSGPRRSTRLAGEAGAITSMGATTVVANGISNSSRYLGGSKLSSAALRSVTIRKGQSWANENLDEGIHNEAFDDSRANVTSTTSSSFPTGDTRSLEGGANVPIGGVVMNGTRVVTGASEILVLLRTLGEGYRLSCMYRCQDALDVYLKLPHKHYNTGWVLSQVGKAYFELVDYLEADRAFSLARRASPYSLEGMDIYSTNLYHLKEDMKLSYLAQELISTDRLAPQSWCAMGNCYSLQKDHETALKNFQRAVQLSSRFAYAHTLCGHEFVALEDFENGIKSYQSALRVDARHYNSWYGLGMIYLRQEKYEFSEHHFRMAFQINPHSSVIMSYLGTALHSLRRSEEAIEMMEKAILADKKNPLPMYQKANILVSLENFDEALELLEELKEYAPRESSVYALMGKIYKRHNMHDKAMLHFGLALDLKPSATDVATIKAAIEKLHVPDEFEDL
ncbi:TPR_2 domain-containing protein/Apc3 domain-containing protein/TPR_11 domain-containing protein [Cephalotus follicularis]|uniref:TPR_2 domain-containing protein/Apc3 domain-containing protein/TPR_11 domain-containing protein n=1 Tax=Cephalotus follicularis TaxID=3775 RepID=A0A1Q3DBS5_CEPFO|nr:TPR_2 domain-containing protein/Apc3 domain-containing protein/TPR_11 domain-containing protein [Cephalotus follicularis]